MGKTCVEVCLISARGLRRSSLWKLQWFAVGWIDPNNKYCTKINASGNANPVWKTKFSAIVDNLQDLSLNIEVHSREPIFLREKLQGTATIILKEFLATSINDAKDSKPGTEQVGSFQLRKRNSNKPQGFIDVSIHVKDKTESTSSYPVNEVGFEVMDHGNEITFTQVNSPELPVAHPKHQYAQPPPFPRNYSNPSPRHPSTTNGNSSYDQARPRPRTPPPPPPPSHVGYIPTFIPRTNNLPDTYLNMPSSSSSSSVARGRSSGPGLGMGLGAGALAAGAVIFGDDFMSGFDFPSGLHDASPTISTSPPL